MTRIDSQGPTVPTMFATMTTAMIDRAQAQRKNYELRTPALFGGTTHHHHGDSNHNTGTRRKAPTQSSIVPLAFDLRINVKPRSVEQGCA